MAIDKTQVSSIIATQKLQENDTSVNSGFAKNKEFIKVTDDTAKKELLKRLEITEEQLNEIVAKYNDFYSLTPEKQVVIVQKNLTQSAEQSEETAENTKLLVEAFAEDKKQDEVKFDNKAYEAASKEEKAKVYAEELAKNNFMYADPENPKSINDWNALSDAEKQKLINASLNNDVKENGKKIFDDDDVDKLLQYKMTKIQAANALKISVKEMDKKGLDYTDGAIHEYVTNLEDDERSLGQQKYLDEQKKISELLVAYSKKHGNVDAWGDGDYILSPSEIQKHCKEMGVTFAEIEREHLEEKQKASGLTPEEKTKLENLQKLDSVIQAVKEKLKDGPVDYGHLKEFDNSEYGKLFALAQGTDEKIAIALKYLKEKNGDVEFAAEFITELVQKDPVLAAQLQERFISSSSADDKKLIAANNAGFNQELNAVNINSFDDESSKIVAETQREVSKTDKKRAEQLAKTTLQNADGTHLTATSDTYAAFGNEEVEIAHVDAALDKKRVDKNQQNAMLKNVYNSSGIKARKYAGVNNDKTYTENQIELHNIAIKDKEVNDAMVEAGTYSRYAKENQVEAFNAHKHRYEQDDYSEKDAINGLNKLSDYISDCDKDNQLAMHEEIMTSKYPEVQEHAAGNIRDYDPSVQADAISAVYKSGNENAINIAVSGVQDLKSPDVQQVALKQVVMESANDDFRNKFLNGTLSDSEIKSLSSAERREYYMTLFDRASAVDKIKYLKEMPAGKNKQTVYNLIGTYYKNLFVQMVQDDVQLAETMFNMGLKAQLHSVVENCIIDKATTNPSYKFLRDRLGLSASEQEIPQTAKTVNYSSIPYNFENDNFALYPKDKYGNLLA